uniref:SFRICE_037396 n=1 Tax=Spodoptera frugiperda TaxID=7108 RepID=A0A2H1VW18_SPOFR
MRYMVSRACRGPCCVASDIPPLLRRCAAVARVALRWGRAMHDAKLHLAYTMDNDGYLTLKVANVPLRSVWEVSMRVELVVDDGRAAPWPRAGAVRVARVVSDVPVHEHELRRALAHTPRDWGHAPRTIWRMFRYLKHKTRDDELLLA